MRLTIKQKILALGKQYRVFDHTNIKIYEIRSDVLSLDRRKVVLDNWGNQLGWVMWPFKGYSDEATFCVGSSSAHMAFTAGGSLPEWQMQLDDKRFFTIQRDLNDMTFVIAGDEGDVATLRKHMMKVSDVYELILDEDKLPVGYALLLVALFDHKYHSWSSWRRSWSMLHPWFSRRY